MNSLEIVRFSSEGSMLDLITDLFTKLLCFLEKLEVFFINAKFSDWSSFKGESVSKLSNFKGCLLKLGHWHKSGV